MHWFGVASLLLVGLLAGCVDSEVEPLASFAEAVPQLVVDGSSVDALEGAIVGPMESEATLDFTLEIPAGWDGAAQALEVSVAWERASAYFAWGILVEDETGNVVAEGMGGWFSSTALVPDPKPGDYTVHIVENNGGAPYEAIVQLEAVPAHPEGEVLLPDLVTLPPTELAIMVESFFNPLAPVTNEVFPGCDPWEIAEQQAKRCLRLSNAVGNLGPGPLEVRLTTEEGAKGLAQSGEFVQRLYKPDGSYEEVAAGPAAFHATHGHFHYQDLATFQVYTYDQDNGVRGELVGTGHKSGFCFFDIGLVELGLPGTTLPIYRDEANCASPTGQNDWVTGLSPNWYDFYTYELTDQYVDMTGVPDGIYELESTANGARTIVESDYDNNSASVLFRLTGNEVEMLEWPDGVQQG